MFAGCVGSLELSFGLVVCQHQRLAMLFVIFLHLLLLPPPFLALLPLPLGRLLLCLLL